MDPDAAPISYREPLKGFAARLTSDPEFRSPTDDPWAVQVALAAQGDADALARLYDGTVALVYGLALRILRDPGGAEEITEDVYIQVWRQAARYDPSRGRVTRWLLSMTRSRAIDRLRAGAAQRACRAGLDEASHVQEAVPSPELAASERQRGDLVRAALARLHPDQRHAVELAYFRGMSHSEIATHVGAPLGTVKTRIRLGMEKLRGSLEMLGEEM